MSVKLSDSQIQALQARVTELEADNQRLRQSEANFRTLFELSSEGIYYAEVEPPCPINLSVDEQCDWVYNNLRVVRVNPAFAAMYGADHPDQLLGLMNADVHVENSEKNAAFIRGIVESGYCFRNLETEEVDQLGQPRFFLNAGIGIVEQGCFVGGWGTQTDITELRQAQQTLLEAEQAKSQELERLNAELRESERRYRTLFELSNEGIYRFEFEEPISLALSPEERLRLAYRVNRLVEVNQAFAEQYGCTSPDEMVGTRISDFYDKAYSQANDQANLTLMRDLRVSDLETVETDRLGHRHWFISSLACEAYDGYIVGGWGVQTDITELYQAQQTLRQAETARAAEQARNEVFQQRDRLLNASANSVSALLTVEDLDEAINQVLKTVGEALNTDRAGVVEFFAPEDSATSLPHWRLLYEWHTLDTPSQLADPTANQGTSDGIEDIYARLEQGDVFSAAIEDCSEPFRSQMATIGVKAMHYVPIFVEGQCWGLLGFDDCQEVKERSSAELSILSIAADCLGSAIQRQRTQQTLQQTEQARAVEQARNEVLQQRDRMLTTVAEATKDLLNSSNTDLEQVIPTALRVLGEGLGCDRINVLEAFGQSTTQILDYLKVIHEWAEPDTVSQIAHQDAAQIDCQGLEVFTEQYLQNNGFGGLVDDWPEPVSSALKAVDVRSSYSVPIWLGEKFWGTVGFDYCHEAKQVSPAEMAILRTAAACIGGAIQRDRTQKAMLQTEQAQVAKLMKTNQALKNNLDRLAAESSLDAFLGHVLTEISQQLNIQTVWFYLYEPIDQTVRLHRWVEQGEVQPPEHFVQLGPMANPIAVANLPIWEHLQQTKTPFVITPENIEQAKQFMFPDTQDWQLQWAKQNNIQSGINSLLMLGETPLGLLGLLSTQRSEYTSEELALVQALAHQATLAIQLTRLADEAKQSTLYEERSRLAGEIHDTLAQTFTGISVQLELAQYLIGQSAKESDRAEVGSTLERISSLAQTGLAEARRSVWSLYSATEDYTKLAERLADCIAALARGTDLHTQVDLKGEPYPLNYFVGKNLLRIGQEAITNTFKHAQATELWVELTYAPEQVSLRVSDNGCGFVPQTQAEGFGLVSISERADRIGGQLRITTQPGQGTEIFVQVPL